jgi:hypothetical protein
MDNPFILFFASATIVATMVYAVTRLNREAAAALVLARGLERGAAVSRGKMKADPVEAPDGWPIAL